MLQLLTLSTIREQRLDSYHHRKLQIDGKVVPWHKLNAQLQFKLKGMRQKVLVSEAADKANAEQEAEIRKAAEQLGIVPISGSIICVTKTGSMVNAEFMNGDIPAGFERPSRWRTNKRQRNENGGDV